MTNLLLDILSCETSVILNIIVYLSNSFKWNINNILLTFITRYTRGRYIYILEVYVDL